VSAGAEPGPAPGPRLAVRAVIVHRDRLLLVNAWRDGAEGAARDLWCAPGGGVERGASLPDTLRREVAEETGLAVAVGAPCLVNEFHDPGGAFHQVEVFFRCTLAGPDAAQGPGWADPDGVVTRHVWAGRAEAAGLRVKPDSLVRLAWGDGFAYDPLEPLVR